MKRKFYTICFKEITLAITSIFLGLSCMLPALAQAKDSRNILDKKVSVNVKNTEIQQVLSAIEKASGVRFVYSSDLIQSKKKVTYSAKDEKVSEILNNLLAPLKISYSLEANNVVVLYPESDQNGDESKFVADNQGTFFQPQGNTQEAVKKTKDITVSGVVTNEKGEPLPAVSVIIKDLNLGTQTSVNGSYSIIAPPNATLVFSSTGYNSREEAINNRTTINVQMIASVQQMTEVVVTALGVKREEKALGYSVQKLNGDAFTKVKPVDIGTSLTGKVAGMTVFNSTEFAKSPDIYLRGEHALLVIDGVPYTNMSLSDIAPDDIESVSVLKGATASALYGSRGGNGAIMITLKTKTKEGGLDVSVSNSTMFASGFLNFPEVQTSYSGGSGGKYYAGDYVWGDKMDIGRTAKQYNPKTNKWEDMPLVSKGKNNLKNFLQTGFITTNNVSVAQTGKYGSYRTSITSVFNKGQYPNTTLNKIIASASGEMKAGKFSMNGGFTYNKHFYPNNVGSGYGGGGYMYNLVIWSGADYDIRDFRNYWVPGKENIQQSWSDNTWYNNPYFIAYETLHGNNYDMMNGYVNASLDIQPWLKMSLRSGIDAYSNTDQTRYAMSTVNNAYKKGYYEIYKSNGFSTNNDLMINANTKIGDWDIDGLLGGSIYYFQSNSLNAWTKNGITVPGYYSIKASVDPAGVSPGGAQKQVNGLYGKLSTSWKNAWFLDITGRNDWSSTLPSNQRSYFYPSVASSLVMSELVDMPAWLSLAKVRGSWTQTKADPGVYSINSTYVVATNIWNGMSTAYYPTTIRSTNILPQTTRTYEVGAALGFLNNRARFDVAYYNKLYFNRITTATVSPSSGFWGAYINIDEDLVRKGMEITLSGTPVSNNKFKWDATFNWSLDHLYYGHLDSIYSSKQPWVKEGKRRDVITGSDWNKAPAGQLILNGSGLPTLSNYTTVLGYSDPKWIWGFINNFKYKQFTLSLSIDGRVGGEAYNKTWQAMWNSGVHPESDNNYRYEEVVNKNKTFIAPGVIVSSGAVERDAYGNIISDTRKFEPNAKVVSYESYTTTYHGNPYSARPQNYFDETFLKLREVSLVYDLPTSIAKKISAKNASIGVVGQNVLLWTKDFKYSDPDWGADDLNSPSVRYLGFNLKVNF